MADIDMSGAKQVTGANGKEYLEKDVGTFDVPDEFQGKFLMLDSKSGRVFFRKQVPMSKEQKDKRAKARLAETKKRWASTVENNKKYTSEIDKIELTHKAYSRSAFAEGALVAASFVNKKKGIFTMEDILNY